LSLGQNGQRAVDAGGVELALRSQGDSVAAAAFNDFEAEGGFEEGEAVADSAAGDSKALCGAGEGAQVCDGVYGCEGVSGRNASLGFGGLRVVDKILHDDLTGFAHSTCVNGCLTARSRRLCDAVFCYIAVFHANNMPWS
jgi:hypothetical protein